MEIAQLLTLLVLVGYAVPVLAFPACTTPPPRATPYRLDALPTPAPTLTPTALPSPTRTATPTATRTATPTVTATPGCAPCLTPTVAPTIAPDALIEMRAHVAYAVDGDTLRLSNGQYVRLVGIDAPEVARAGKQAQPYAVLAKGFATQEVAEEDVAILARQKPDMYGRTLGYVRYGSGKILNEEMLKRGLARVMLDYPFPEKDRYLALEAAAKKAKVGLWQ